VFFDAGAKVSGADAGEELVEFAKRLVPEAAFRVADSHRLLFVADASMDKIAIVLALQNIKKLQETIIECARVLKPTGKLFIVLNHPSFRVPRASAWGFDEKMNVQYRRVDSYLSESQIQIDMHPGSDKKVFTTSFHRPLQVYMKALAKSGFVITRLEEWISHRKSEAGPRQQAEDKARNEIPLFLALEVKIVKI
jgi:ubiquinone/menaquinone biosynthesis C-methylase UbiE